MRCPKCGSRQLKSCEAAYLMGSRWGSRQTLSELAQRCAPPTRNGKAALEALAVFLPWLGLGVALLVGVWSLLYVDGRQAALGQSYWAFLWLRLSALSAIWYVLAVCFVIAAWRYLRDSDGYAQRYEEWQKSWICMQCAAVSAPELKSNTRASNR